MKEIVINKCYGGFGLSSAGLALYARKKYNKSLFYYYYDYEENIYKKTVEPDKHVYFFAFLDDYGDSLKEKEISDICETDDYITERKISRDDIFLVAVVKEMGAKANGECANLCIVEIPDNVNWTIEEYDGSEWIAETHRTWY